MDDIQLNKNDYRVLNMFRSKKAYSKLKGLTIKQISEEVELSQRRIRLAKDKLLALNYIEEGVRDGRSNTFFITEKGKSELIEIASGVLMQSNNNGGNC